MYNILIVEDDREIALLEQDYLELEEFGTQIVQDGEEAVRAVLSGSYDLVLLDVMLPGCSGYDVCRRIRDLVDVPILMVTARTGTEDVVEGLGLGADDYIAKPFDPAELVARVKTHISRYERLAEPGKTEEEPPEITAGDLRILPQSGRVWKGDRELRLPKREFALLKFLAEHPNTMFSKERLFTEVWNSEYVGEGATVHVHIGRIRAKIEDDPAHPCIIETVRGRGYRFNPTGRPRDE